MIIGGMEEDMVDNNLVGIELKSNKTWQAKEKDQKYPLLYR